MVLKRSTKEIQHATFAQLPEFLSPGDLVVLTSDGVAEATNMFGELLGFERLSQAIATGPTNSAAAMLSHLKAEVAEFTGKAEPRDDMTIIVVRI